MAARPSSLPSSRAPQDEKFIGFKDTAFHAITLRAPWAVSLVHGPKRVENREYFISLWTGKAAFRDVWLAVHVSASLNAEETAIQENISESLWPGIEHQNLKDPLRHIIGIAHVKKVTKDYNEAVEHQGLRGKDWVDESSRYYWLIDKVVPLAEPIGPVQGRRKVWTVKDELIVKKLQSALFQHLNTAPPQSSKQTVGQNAAATSEAAQEKGGTEKGGTGAAGTNAVTLSTDESRSSANMTTTKRKKKKKRKLTYSYPRSDILLSFHILNQSGSGRVHAAEIVRVAKQHDVDISHDEANKMVQYAKRRLEKKRRSTPSSVAGAEYVTMDAYMTICEEAKLCAPLDTPTPST
mmetsp:Transcript_5104/g.8330  ORF Transcript_5104/g.8330 Transcript_5104/m.8330 type:complete len:351 (-) Transcript_5104:162-1214(-)